MGFKQTIKDPQFREELEALFDSLSTLYNLSVAEFIIMFNNVPKYVLNEMIRIKYLEGLEGTEDEDIADYAGEILYYYTSYHNKIAESRKLTKAPKVKSFTLRNSEDLKNFHTFLLSMDTILNRSVEEFVKEFPKCPQEYWDKVDDLREASYTYKYGSEMYKTCLRLCKELSAEYSKQIYFTDGDEGEV